jgi:Na+-driven multidrug efflux pump
MAFNSYTNAAYFTLRSGGKTMVTFLFDSCFMWVVCVPLAWVFSRIVPIGILPLYMLCQGTDLIKCVLGWLMVRKGGWIQNLTQ